VAFDPLLDEGDILFDVLDFDLRAGQLDLEIPKRTRGGEQGPDESEPEFPIAVFHEAGSP
jgi:hypothetical protein